MSELLAETLLAGLRPGTILTTGLVTADATGDLVAVNISGQIVNVRKAKSYNPAKKGDVALIAATADGRTYALLSLATGSGGLPPDPPPPLPTTGTNTFPATGAGSYRGGRFRTDRSHVIEGDWGGFGLNTGAWVYGTAPAGTLAGATITAAEIFIDRRTGGWNAAQHINLYPHNETNLPSNTPGLMAAAQSIGTMAVGAAAWLPVPIDWAQKIAKGTWRGLGIQSTAADPYVVLASLGQNGSTGALRLTWQR